MKGEGWRVKDGGLRMEGKGRSEENKRCGQNNIT